MNNKCSTLVTLLKKEYPAAESELEFSSPLELLIATILSAQCTDKRVNEVTKVLFNKCKTAEDYAKCSLPVLEEIIKSTGFFKQKSKSISECCRSIEENFNGDVPDNMEDLISLAGVGRKTASVVLANGFNKPAIAVDTHVKRISNRLGLVDNQDPGKIEFELRRLFDREVWGFLSNALILHGRRVCKARKPLCESCCLQSACDYYQK